MEYVNHPRYGNNPIPSGEHFDIGEIRSAHWRYHKLTFFAHTAIAADTAKQNYVMYPRKIYVDIEQTCKSCSRKFIFFAKEQQYWFEELSFYVDSHCTKCFSCRSVSRETKRLECRYQILKIMPNRTPEQIDALRRIAAQLYQRGRIKNKHLLNVVNRVNSLPTVYLGANTDYYQ